MNNLAQLIAERRSCRKFTGEAVSDADVLQLKRAALSAPTSKNCKSWEFVFVQDKATIEALSQSKESGAAFVKGAALAIVVFGRTSKTDIWVEDASIASSFLLLQAADLGLGFSDGRTARDIAGKLLNAPSDVEPLAIIAIGHPAESHRPYSDDRLPWGQVHDEKF